MASITCGPGRAGPALVNNMQTDLRLNWLIAVALTGWLFYLLAPVLTPFVAAALLAYMGDPLADRLQKLRMPDATLAADMSVYPNIVWWIGEPNVGNITLHEL